MEPIQNIPEQGGTANEPLNRPDLPFQDQQWITVNQAIILFRALGLPRTKEAIRKYCRQEKLSATMMEGAKGQQHMVETASIYPFVDEQLKVLNAAGQAVTQRDGTIRNIPVYSVASRNEPERFETDENERLLADQVKKLEAELEELKAENRELEIDKRVRGEFARQLQTDRDRIYDQAMRYSEQVGQLKEQVKVLQLGSGSSPSELPSKDSEPMTVDSPTDHFHQKRV